MTDSMDILLKFDALKKYLKMFPNEYVVTDDKRIKYVDYHEQLRLGNEKYILEDELGYVVDCYTGANITGHLYAKLELVGERNLSASQKKNILEGIDKDVLEDIINTVGE